MPSSKNRFAIIPLRDNVDDNEDPIDNDEIRQEDAYDDEKDDDIVLC